MILNPNVWGPHYWFVMHTIAMGYPKTPNETCRRKYYDLINNIPLIIPSVSFGNIFTDLLDKYPVTPYLDSQDSFIKWVHFIHNKINVILGKPEIPFDTAMTLYNRHYIMNTPEIVKKKSVKLYVNIIEILLLFYISYKLYIL